MADLDRSLIESAPRISEVVITGGPCSGKTSSLAYLSEKLRDYGFRVFVVPEVSTMLRLGGLHDLMEIEQNDRELYFHTQVEHVLLRRALRERFRALAEGFPPETKSVIVHDRGEMDTSSYMTPDEWQQLMEELELSAWDVRDSYASVVHLVTVARDLPQLYTLENNDARQEGSLADAVEADDRTLRAWLGHPRLRIVGNDTDDFHFKLRKTLQAVLRGLGVPVPLQAEKKFLLTRLPDLMHPVLAAARAIEIEQTYLLSAEPERELRVRRRTEAGSSTFYRTEKVIIPELEARQEKEQRISSGDYERLLASRDPQLSSIVKTRYSFGWGSSYMELDVFENPAGIAILEVEATEGGRLELPPFLEIDRDVTGEPGWMNHTLAAARCELPTSSDR